MPIARSSSLRLSCVLVALALLSVNACGETAEEGSRPELGGAGHGGEDNGGAPSRDETAGAAGTPADESGGGRFSNARAGAGGTEAGSGAGAGGVAGTPANESGGGGFSNAGAGAGGDDGGSSGSGAGGTEAGSDAGGSAATSGASSGSGGTGGSSSTNICEQVVAYLTSCDQLQGASEGAQNCDPNNIASQCVVPCLLAKPCQELGNWPDPILGCVADCIASAGL